MPYLWLEIFYFLFFFKKKCHLLLSRVTIFFPRLFPLPSPHPLSSLSHSPRLLLSLSLPLSLETEPDNGSSKPPAFIQSPHLPPHAWIRIPQNLPTTIPSPESHHNPPPSELPSSQIPNTSMLKYHQLLLNPQQTQFTSPLPTTTQIPPPPSPSSCCCC